jgi:hypothetical protein
MAPATNPTTMPVIHAAQGMIYAACLGILLPAAGFFPVFCFGIVRRRGRLLPVLAVITGVLAITAAAVLSKPFPSAILIVTAWFGAAMAGAVLYAMIRRRIPIKPAAPRVKPGPAPRRRANGGISRG